MLGGRFAVRHEIFEEQSWLVTSRFAWRPDASESFPPVGFNCWRIS